MKGIRISGRSKLRINEIASGALHSNFNLFESFTL